MDVRSSSSAGSSEASPALHSGAGIYSPLDKSNSEIRLLTLRMLPTQPNGATQLHASTETFSFDSDNIPVYQALSYEWNPPNSPSTTEVLKINGKEKHISTNLMCALLCLAMNKQPISRFWVDALCINQEDTAERSHQVQLMRRIYGEAALVYVWLGIRWTLKEGQWALSLLRSLLGEYNTQVLEEGTVQRVFSHLRDDENYKDYREAVHSLFSQSYWSRSSIVQELVAAKKALLLTNESPGPSKIIRLDHFMLFLIFRPTELSSYDRFTDWATIPSSTEDVDTKAVRHRMNPHPAVEAISNTKTAVNSDTYEDHNDLLSLLTRFCGQLATNPRDKVYSLLGIEKPNSNDSIIVDYSLKWTEVFRDAAIHGIRDRNDLEVLVYAGSRVSDLPSWVPDWLDQERQGTARFPHDKYCLNRRCCSPHTARTPLRANLAGRRLPTISDNRSLLTISANLFDIQPCSMVDIPGGDLETRKAWPLMGELGNMMFSTWRANEAILDDSDPDLPAADIFLNFIYLWWYAIFYFHPAAFVKLERLPFCMYIASSGRQSLTQQQQELLQHALDEQFPFLTKVPPSVGSAIFRSDTLRLRDAEIPKLELVAQRILDRQASVHIPGMCFWSSDRGSLGTHHVLALIPLCRFPIILSKPEGSGTGYKVTTSARVAKLEHGQIQQGDGTTFELPLQEIALA